jgi:Tfp pilus assembly protein PilZ
MAECQTAEDVFQDRVNDLSASGLFLQTDRRLAIGQEIAMTIPLPESHGIVIKVTGEVVRTTVKGVGVAFKVVFNY